MKVVLKNRHRIRLDFRLIDRVYLPWAKRVSAQICYKGKREYQDSGSRLTLLKTVRVRPASQNPQAANQFAQEIVQSSSGNPTPAKLTSGALGLAREAQVTTITGGKVARQEVLVKGLGRTDIDVIGKAGEYIAVGGPAKTPSDVGRQLQILKAAAEQSPILRRELLSRY